VLKVRVLIADDHGVVAGGLRSLVDAEADMEVVALAENGREAARLSLRYRPDVVVMDHEMPELNGTEATREIRARCPDTRVIILSMHSDAVHIRRALQAGASGYLAKKSAAEEVVRAIRAVHGGQRYLSRRLTGQVLDELAGKSAEDPLARLSRRERQVLQLIAEGHSTSEIAGRLSLSANTVETYRARMMEKLDLRDLAGLVRFAIREGVTALE
jgi:DNA-binding NarL/FixJ family response regulator